MDCGSDASNCGACGIVCGEGYVCNAGACVYIGVTHYINISNMEYEFASLEIRQEDTVVWTNQDSIGHTVTSNDSY
ncbi:MAG: hypothetical protein ACPF9X_06525, partial [Candidatus Poseidoniaceae archaeon]